ncbi:MAG: GCN5-related N-acetyltransferase [Phycisphaerales bacterium]|nr:GCN5-related N-acetyltransferase [Phycisphaerales bacterium]
MDDPLLNLPTLQTPRLALRYFRVTDAARVQLLAGDFRVAQMTVAIPHPYPDGAAEAWIATHDNLWREQGVGTWAICRAPEGAEELVGCVSLITNRKHNRADFGYWIGVDYWNHGYCTEAAAAVMAFGFNTMKLARIGAVHLASNPASGRVMQKLGMTCEGTQRHYILHRGESSDVVNYGILPSDPRPASAR